MAHATYPIPSSDRERSLPGNTDAYLLSANKGTVITISTAKGTFTHGDGLLHSDETAVGTNTPYGSNRAGIADSD